MKALTFIFKNRIALISGVLILFLFTSVSSIAGDDNKVTIGDKVLLKSKALGEERAVMVYTPRGYDLTNSSYPVIYLLDGENHFFHASGVVDFLSTQGKMPQALVVAIVNVDRGRDFTPTQVEKKQNTGGAEKFTAFISDELMPYVNKHYRTEPYNILVGHSLGGMYAAYSMLTRPDLFNAYIAISPYLAYDDNFVVKTAESKLQSKYSKGHKSFYMTLGNEPEYFEPVGKFAQIVKNASPEGLDFTYVKMEKEDHGTIPHLSIYNGLESIYSDWKLPQEKYEEGLASIDKHYQWLSDKYGYTIETPEFVINWLGYTYLQKKENPEMALEVFKENIQRYPKSANVYDSYGEALEKSGQIEDARKNYEKAVALAEKTNHPYLTVFRDNLLRVQQEVAEK